MRLISGLLASLSALLLGGCLYGFAGGGLPSNIKTVAVLPFDNQTPEPTLTQEINAAVRDAVEGRLGLRQASERQADAVVRGTITRYQPDLPVAYNGDDQGGGGVTVTRRLVQISVSVEIMDQAQQQAALAAGALREVLGHLGEREARRGRAGNRIRVVDTESASLGITLLGLGVQRRLERGTTDGEIEALLEAIKQETGSSSPSTRSSSSPAAGASAGSGMEGELLSIKPILTIDDGEIVPVKRVRGNKKAFAEFTKTFEEATADPSFAARRRSRMRTRPTASSCAGDRARAARSDKIEKGDGARPGRRHARRARRSRFLLVPRPKPAALPAERRLRRSPHSLRNARANGPAVSGFPTGFRRLDPPERWPPTRGRFRPERLERAARLAARASARR